MTIDPIGAASRAQAALDPRKLKAAQEFEGVFVALLLKEARAVPTGGLFGGEDGLDLASGLAEPILGDAIARAGGLGIAAVLARAM
jgi:Rod binding domain-containing protein